MRRTSCLLLAAGVSASLALALLDAEAVRHPVQDAPRAVSLVVTGGTVITMDPDGRILEPGAVAIDEGAIVAIDTPAAIDAAFDAAERLEVPGDLVLPGLVNTHTHAPMVLFRGLADDLALMEWLEGYVFPAEAATVSPEMVRVGTALAALEMIESGTTTFVDMYYFEEAIAEATRRAGLRAVLGQTVIGFPAPDAQTPEEALLRAERFIRAWKPDPLVTPAVAPHALYTTDGPTLTAARDLAEAHDVPLLIHLAESEAEVRTARDEHRATPVGYLASLGLLDARLLAAHCVWLTDDDIRTLVAARVACSHNPESNMKLASGIAPVPKMLDAGLVVGLGTDGAASNNDLDMFEAMRQAALLHKVATGDPEAIPARIALELATLGGARALGLADRIGSLEPGKRADLITVATDSARATPLYDPVSHLVYVARGTDVRTTIVDGRVLMAERRVTTLDVDRVLADARGMAERVREAVHERTR